MFLVVVALTHLILECMSFQRSNENGPPGPRSGWQSPSYDDVLDRKRQEEARYRRDDPTGMRAYNSEGAIDTLVCKNVLKIIIEGGDWGLQKREKYKE